MHFFAFLPHLPAPEEARSTLSGLPACDERPWVCHDCADEAYQLARNRYVRQAASTAQIVEDSLKLSEAPYISTFSVKRQYNAKKRPKMPKRLKVLHGCIQ